MKDMDCYHTERLRAKSDSERAIKKATFVQI